MMQREELGELVVEQQDQDVFGTARIRPSMNSAAKRRQKPARGPLGPPAGAGGGSRSPAALLCGAPDPLTLLPPS